MMALLCIISFHNEWNEDKWHIRLTQTLVGHNLNCVKGFFSMCWTHFLSSCHILLCHAPFALISIHQQYRFTFHSTCIVFVCTSYTTMYTIERLNDSKRMKNICVYWGKWEFTNHNMLFGSFGLKICGTWSI